MCQSLPTPAQGGVIMQWKTDNFRAWRQAAYRNATIVWCLLLLCAYTTTLIRTPIAVYSQVCLLSTLFMLTCTVLLAAWRGSTQGMTVTTSVLMLFRSLGYAGIGLGIVTLDFKPQLFAAPGSKSQVPLPTFSCLAVLLFDSIGLVHARAPWLQLCLQIISATISNMSSGNTLASSMMMSLGVHSLCGLVSVLMERWDRQCFAAVLEKQHRLRGGGSAAALSCKEGIDSHTFAVGGTEGEKQKGQALETKVSPATAGPAAGVFQCMNSSSCTNECGDDGSGSSGVSVAANATGEGNRGEEQQQRGPHSSAAGEEGDLSHVGSTQELAAAAVNSQTQSPPALLSPASRQELLRALQLRVRGPEGIACLQRVNLLSTRLRTRHTYEQQSYKHHVVLKVPDPVHPGSLPASAVPNLCYHIHTSCPGYTVASGAVRAGCVLVTLDLQRDLSKYLQEEAGCTEQGLFDAGLARAAQNWLQDTQLAAQLPASAAIQLQVDGRVVQMVQDTSTQSWSIKSISPLAAPLHTQTAIQVLSPVALLPPPSHDQPQQHAKQLQGEDRRRSSSSCKSGSIPDLEVDASVCMPAGVELRGWAGNDGSPAPGGDAIDGAGELAASGAGEAKLLQERSSGSYNGNGQDGSQEVLCILAHIEGHGYAPTCVVPERVASDDAACSVKASVKVCVSVPEHVVLHDWPRLLRLELWHGDVLLSSSSSILLPACMPGAASELQGLPWGSEGTEDLADYLVDLGHWLHQNHAGSVTPSSDPTVQAQQQKLQQQQQQGPTPWEVGVSLLQQSVLWGLPSVSTLLVDTLMGGLPSAPADAPFAHLAHAPVRDTTAAATAGQSFPEQDGFEISLQDMGGLLHLSLLCPHASSMLAAVLDWGRRWGSKEPGFTWRWNERSAVGVVPLDILSTLPRDSEVLQMLLRDPVQGRALLAAALESAQEREASAKRDGEGSAELGMHAYALSAPASAESVPPAVPTALSSMPEHQQQQQQQQQGTAPPSSPPPPSAPTAAGAPKLPLKVLCLSAATADVLRSAVLWLTQGTLLLLSVLVSWRQGLLGSKQQQQQQQQQSSGKRGLRAVQTTGDGGSVCAAAAADDGGGVGGGRDSAPPCHLRDSDGAANSVSTKACIINSSSGSADCTAPVAFSEAEFRSWANAQAVHSVRRWCFLNTTQMLAALIRQLMVSGYPGFWSELLTLFTLPGYLLGYLALKWAPQHSEVVVCALMCCRCCTLLAFGSSWTAGATMFRFFVNLRLEIAAEAVLMSVLEEVRMSWLVPLRFALFCSYALAYMRLGLTCPWGQLAILNLSCVAVRFAAERRLRNLYSQRLRRLFGAGGQQEQQQQQQQQQLGPHEHLHKAQCLQ